MSGSRLSAPNDPTRRDRILEGALDVIAEHGVHRTTHRRIAARAEVPLGSLTYYFANLDDILERAFERMAESMSVSYRAALAEASDRDSAERAVVDLICGPSYVDGRTMSLIFEMYAFANHNRTVAGTTRSWILRSRSSLTIHFPTRTARALDVLIEGWPMHRSFEDQPLDRELVATTVRAIVDSTARVEDINQVRDGEMGWG